LSCLWELCYPKFMEEQKPTEPSSPEIAPAAPVAPQGQPPVAETVIAPTAQSPVPPAPEAPKSNKKMLMIIGVVIVLLILAAVAVLAFTQMQRPTETAMEPSPTPEAMIEEPTPTPEAMVVDTTGWESYAGEGYTLMYPSTFTASDTEENGDKGVSLLMHGEIQKNSGRTQTELFDGVVVKTLLAKETGQTLEEYSSSEYQIAKSGLDPNSDDYFTDLVKTAIAGQDAYVYDIHGYSDAKVYYLSVNENILKIIVIYAGSEDDVPGYLSLADQILSTFEFTQ